MVRGDQVGHEGGAEDPQTGNKNFDRRYKKHSEAIKDFSVREKSGINDGIVYDRSCTDVFFLLLMIATFIGIFAVAVYALVAGDPHKFIAPYDAEGQMCGFKAEGDNGLATDVRDYPYLYFTKLDTSDLVAELGPITRSGVCVRECPDAEQVKDAAWW